MVETLRSSYDLIVVGAGPAGSSAAQEAARKGVKVLLIERRQRIGMPVQCAELVSKWIFRYVSLRSSSIVQSIDSMVIHLPDQTSLKIKSPGYMLDRSLFDKDLVIAAVLAGAEFSIGIKGVKMTEGGVLIQEGTKEEKKIGAKVIIGADGVHSTVASWIKQPPLKHLVALQYEIVLFEPQSHTDIYFHRDYEGGYAWFFPKGNRANVGIGITLSKTSGLQELLDRFLNDLKNAGTLPRIEILSKTGGSIPCEPRKQIVFGNILLAGDAAGHAHPITGAGILNAIVSGQIAGKMAGEAILRKDLNYLKNYETQCHDAFGDSLQYGSLKRNFLEENWNKKEVEFNQFIRKTWVGFKEYYEERRKDRK